MCRGPSSPNASPWRGRSDIAGLTRFATRAGQFGQPRPAIGGDAAAKSSENGRPTARAGSGKDFAIPPAVMRPAAARLLAFALVVAVGATALGQSSPADDRRRLAAALPGRQLVEPGREPGAAGARESAALIGFINNGGNRRLHPDFGGYSGRTPATSTASPTWSCPAPSPSARCSSITTTRATASARRSIRFPIRRSRSRTGSKAGRRATRRPGGDRHMLIVDRDNKRLYELFDLGWDGTQVDRRLRRVLRPAGQRPPARRLDVGGRGRDWRSCPASCATTRSTAPARSPMPSASRCAPPTASTSGRPRTWPAATRGAAQGHAAAAEGVEGHLGLSAGDAEDLPRDEEVRPHRRRQRIGHVHQRRLRSALGQRRPQPGVPQPPRQRLRGDSARLARRRRPAATAVHRPGARRPNLWSSVTGYGVSLGWTPPAGALAGHVLDVGSGPGSTNIGSLPIAAPAAGFAATAPAGRYYVRVRAGAACGVGAGVERESCSTCRRGAACPRRRARWSSRASRAPCRWPGGRRRVPRPTCVEAGYAPGAVNAAILDVGASRSTRRPGAARHLLRAGPGPERLRAAGAGGQRGRGRGSLTAARG